MEKDTDDVAPTVGFSVEKFDFGSSKLNVVDMSGQSVYQKLWTAYVVDSICDLLKSASGIVKSRTAPLMSQTL